MIILVPLLFIVLFAFFYARQQAQLYWPFRELSDAQFELGHPGKKKELSDAAHTYSKIIATLIITGTAIQSGILLRLSQAPYGYKLGVNIILLEVLYFFSYWLLFDIVFATSFNQKWYYLGDTDKADVFTTKALGPNAGKIKAVLCLTAIADALYFLFSH